MRTYMYHVICTSLNYVLTGNLNDLRYMSLAYKEVIAVITLVHVIVTTSTRSPFYVVNKRCSGILLSE